jgi:hypothetical protein
MSSPETLTHADRIGEGSNRALEMLKPQIELGPRRGSLRQPRRHGRRSRVPRVKPEGRLGASRRPGHDGEPAMGSCFETRPGAPT